MALRQTPLSYTVTVHSAMHCPILAVTVAVPASLAVIFPLDTETTDGSELFQLMRLESVASLGWQFT